MHVQYAQFGIAVGQCGECPTAKRDNINYFIIFTHTRTALVT